MNLLSSFGDFYNNLSSDGLFFFWIVVFLFCFLLFLSIVLLFKNKKLTKLLGEEEKLLDNALELDSLVVKEHVDIKAAKDSLENIVEEQNFVMEEVIIEDKKNDETETKQEESGLYKKNVLREMNARKQTSPISISNDDVVYNTHEDDNYGFDETYLREESVSPLEEMEDNYEINDNMKFASEIVERMEEEIKPSNIELTDYEKKQEEEAIISYDELLKVKDKIYNITEDEETDEFIDELKSFRLDL